MTPFEIIILVLIYCSCYGYACTLLEIDDENCWDRIIRIIASIIVAFYVPIIIGIQIAHKLNESQEERQKENELLLNVLKDGLPYRLQLQITDINEFTFNGELSVLSKNWCRLKIADPNKRAKVKNQTIPLNYIYIKPYLRPMSSMTEEEKKEYFGRTMTIDIVKTSKEVIDWLNARHFDYRGLIKKGLALEAPEGMYN